MKRITGTDRLDMGNIVLHIGDSLDDDQIHQLEYDIALYPGVYSVCTHEKTRHLMVVDFDPTQVRPSSIVHSVRDTGLRAEMVGL